MTAEAELIFDKTVVWGNYYGFFLAIVGLIVVAISLIFVGSKKVFVAMAARGDMAKVRLLLATKVMHVFVVAIPSSVLVATLAVPLARTFTMTTPDVAISILQSGSALIFLFSFSLFWYDILQGFKKTGQMAIMIIGGLVVHVAMLMWLLETASEASSLIVRVVVANLVSGAFMFILGLCFVTYTLKLPSNWVREKTQPMVVAIISGAVSGILALLLSKVMIDFVGSVVTIIICFFVSIVVYMLLLMLLRGLTESELSQMPGGYLMVRLGQLFKVF